MRLSDRRSHSPSCRHYIPIRTADFGGKVGNDRVVRTWPEAIGLALDRAPIRGRQTVRQHTGWLLKRVWVVQDVRETSS